MVKNKKSVRHKISKKTLKPKSLVRRALSKAKSTIKAALNPVTEKVEVTVVRKTLGKAPEEYHFVLHDGRKLKSLYELVDELETMSEDAFKEYVSDFRNDFANWAKDVFQAPDLAEELGRIKNRFDTQRAVMKHMLRDARHYVAHASETVKSELNTVQQNTSRVKEQHEQANPHVHHPSHMKGVKCVIK